MPPSKRVIYTCVTGGYDVVFPPLFRDPGIDYVLLTDDPGLRVEGWQVRLIEPREGMGPSALNRYHKIFCHRVFPEYRSSLYIDGNLRPIASLARFFDRIEAMPCDIQVRQHLARSFVIDEVEACIRSGKVKDEGPIRAEYAALLADGFEDRGELMMNNVLLRDHTAPALDAAMSLWWHYISTYSGRDQISLPHVLRKTGLRRGHAPRLSEVPTKCLQPYPHFGKATGRRRLKAYLKARGPEGRLFRLAAQLAQRI